MTANPPPISKRPNPSPRYVGFWERVLAALIDSILLLIITIPPLLWIYGWEYFNPDTGIVAGVADALISWVLPGLLVIIFWNKKQATPGKMFLHMEIVDAVTGGKPTTRQCIVRYVGYFISLLPMGFGYLWVAFDPRKQAWHDKMAGTVVIKHVSHEPPPLAT